MKLQCRKCGLEIEIPPELKHADDPRVMCPGCQATYRLRKQGRKTPATGASQVVPPRPSSTVSDLPDLTAALGGDDGPTRRLERPASGPVSPPSAAPPSSAPPSQGAPPIQLTTPSQWTPASGTQAASQPMVRSGGGPVFDPGTQLAQRYQVVRFLAQGGMGEVYEAQDLELRQRVALKTISPHAHGSVGDAPEERFKREIALARVVTHPNVCRIFDLGVHVDVQGQRTTFLTMELLEGETLSSLLRRKGRLGTREALPVVRQMAAALDAAHHAGIVHRDFKSENVFLVPSADGLRAVVTDFGVARGNEATDQFAAQVTGTAIVGTPAYMAPEQVEGGAITPAADVYALGIVIYEMVSGALPFQGPNPLSTAVKRLKEAPPPPTVHAPDVPVAWERVILRCLERLPARRYTSAGEVSEALDQAPTSGVTGAFDPRGTGTVPTAPGTGATSTPSGAAVGYPDTWGTSTGAGTVADPALGTSPASPAGAAPATGPGTLVAPPPATQPAVSKARPLALALAAVVLLSTVLFFYNQRTKEGRRVVPRRSVAVFGFENLNLNDDGSWLATGLAEMLSSELSSGGGLRTIPNDTVDRARRELGLARGNELPLADLQRFHSLVGADFVVSGSYAQVGDDMLRLDVRLQDAARGAVVSTFDRQGESGALFEMVNGLGDDLRSSLGIDAAGDEDPLAGLPSDPDAARLYANALEQLRAQQPQQARESLTQALGYEPDNPLLHAALSSAWDAEGYSQQAAEEARRAFEHSTHLPREDRLVIEGRVREAEGDWLAAAEIYTTLWDYFPDDLEYGLRLVSAENAANRPLQALRAIDRLRQLPVPLADDPRIDLGEAHAAALMAEPERQLQAAQRAAGRALPLGANLLVAQARISESQAHLRLGQLEPAAERAREALDLYTEADSAKGRALALGTLANTYVALGRLPEAAEHYQEAIDSHRWSGDQAGTALGLNNLALVLKRQGELDRAQRLYEEAEALYRETRNAHGIANTTNNLGVLLVERDELATALENFEATREQWETLGNPASLAFVLNNIAEVERLQGRLFDSRQTHQRALEIRRESGQKMALATSLNNLARIHFRLGDLANARAQLEEAKGLAEEIGAPAVRAEVAHLGGLLAIEEDRLDDAYQLLDEALQLRTELGLDRAVSDTRLDQARLALVDRQAGRAEVLLREEIERFHEAGRQSDRALAQALLARSLGLEGRVEEARGAALEALSLGAETERRTVSLEVEIHAQWADGLARAASPERLQTLGRQLDDLGDVALRLEASLALAEVGGRDLSTALGDLESLEAEAENLGFSRIARQARELRQSLGNPG